MAKKQTRRSVSLGLVKFKAAQRRAAALGVPVSQLCEDALDAYLAGEPQAIPRKPLRDPARAAQLEEIATTLVALSRVLVREAKTDKRPPSRRKAGAVHDAPMQADGSYRGFELASNAAAVHARMNGGAEALADLDPDAAIEIVSCAPLGHAKDCPCMGRPTCVLCTRPCVGDRYYRLPFGKDDARVPVCLTCNDEHPRSGRYSFDGGARSSISPSDSKRVVRQGGS